MQICKWCKQKKEPLKPLKSLEFFLFALTFTFILLYIKMFSMLQKWFFSVGTYSVAEQNA